MANTNLHGEDLIRHCGLNDEGKAVEQMVWDKVCSDWKVIFLMQDTWY